MTKLENIHSYSVNPPLKKVVKLKHLELQTFFKVIHHQLNVDFGGKGQAYQSRIS